MDWLAENWFWVLVGIVFIAMHLFGHGGHGGHGMHGKHGKQDDYEDKDQQPKSQTPDSGHKHH
ncbi:hypothetical protein BMS3Abin03_02436 [bacterium BMS3Abin03]|nr:hypothetical protein BMS3Abin03_02436 [bacterium BMS3Abin03]